jgi:hypothetical protein
MKKPRVLVVDDDELNVKLTEKAYRDNYKLMGMITWKQWI